ncbi:MAG: hypothetical protein QW273_02770 [Candidatus Pacearchaeota archaeon]
MVNKLGLTVGVCLGIISALELSNYLNKPKIAEMELLKSNYSYIQKYEGQHHEEILDYSQKTLEIISQSNPKIQEVVELKKEISKIKEDFKNKSEIKEYRQSLKDISEKMKRVYEKYGDSSKDLWLGVLNGAASLGWLVSSYEDKKRRKY